MIFKLFKTKNTWQHKDVNIRISAINEQLKSESGEDKAILLSLLNSDESELVRRAVLLKLNSFNEYFNASNHNDNKKIQAFASSQVQEILSGKHKIVLPLNKKQYFLSTLTESNQHTSSNITLLNFWLEHEVEPSLIASLFDALIAKKNVAQFLLQVFSKKKIIEVQKHLLSLDLKELNDVSLLTKLSKKAINEEVSQLISDRLVQIAAQSEKPKKLLKQIQLLLSKLLALKDQPSYGKYLENRVDFDKQWQESLTEFNCLAQEEQDTLLNKYEKITGQLEQIFAPKAEAYHQTKIAEQLVNDKLKAQKAFNTMITLLNQHITTAVFESQNTDNELINQSDFTTQVNQLRHDISTSVLNDTEQQHFLQKLTQLEKRLTQLPEIAESVSEATYLISKISQFALPKDLSELNERQQTYYDWLMNYKAINKKSQGVLPQSIIDAHKEITNIWKNGLQPLQKEQRQLFDQTNKKLNDVKRLLASGKYKVCFGLFKGVSQSIPLLSTQQQQQLQRDFDSVSEKIAEISDWEHYIATPRKQELLKEINALISSPLNDPNAQADKVKYYRKTWNSLGHADESIDKELNEQFNLACEEAFAPCRLFYAEQEKLRAVHLVTRNNIVNDAHELSKSINVSKDDNLSIDFKELDGKLNKLQQRWQQAGEVDRHEYQKLFKAFKNSIQPIKKSIKSFHDANSVKKQNLITQAQQQLTLDDVYQAIQTIKQLQQQWRDIGFAGSHQESKLWQVFRSINDQVFAKRDLAKSEQQAELTEVADRYNQTLATIAKLVDNVAVIYSEKHTFLTAKEQADALLSQVIAHKPVIKSVVTKIEDFISAIKTNITQINTEQERKNWQSVFALLEKIAHNNSNIATPTIVDENEYQNLTNFWQKRVIEQCLLTFKATTDLRAEKTLALEILAQVPSPAELAQQRMAVQVSLMQEQMQTSEVIDLQEKFTDWLALGKLEADDLPLLLRVKKIFVA